jgi:predicted O-linked N-acetylglucosamine transferase (SPINDLY family)
MDQTPEADIDALRRAAEERPLDVAVRTELGRRLALAGRYPDAVEVLKRALELQADAAQAWLELGRVLGAAGRPLDAVRVLDAAVSVVTPSAALLVARGQALLGVRRDREALECFERARELEPSGADAPHRTDGPHRTDARIGMARSLLRLRRAEEALAGIDALLIELPGCAEAHAVRALLLFLLQRLDEAFAAAGRSAELDPKQALPDVVHGLALQRAGRPAEALARFDAALSHEQYHAAAQVGRAQALEALERLPEALEATLLAGRLDPENLTVYLMAARLMIRAQRFAEAAEYFDQALRRNEHCIEALRGRAQCLAALRRAEEALEAYERLLAIAPDSPYLSGERFYVQMSCCDWTDYEARRQELAARVRRGERVSSPGSFLAHSDSPADQLICARTYAADRLAVGQRVTVARRPAAARGPGVGQSVAVTQRVDPPAEQRMGQDRIRVAYVSADFHAHPTAFLAAGLFERHDRDAFEVIGISYGPNDGSEMRRRLERAFDRFVDVSGLSDLAIAERIAELGVDIAVDLKGHTLGGRPEIFAYRPAPIQVSFLAYPGTMGVDFLDYLVADRQLIPERNRPHYSESILFLPDSYQVNDAARPAPASMSRREAGLPESGFVFCCFNVPYKITPGIFDAWMEILKAVPGSVLWLLDGAPSAVRNLTREAAGRGVGEHRLVFAPGLEPASHWQRCPLADLFLDTLPTNAHTTASDALWAGVPLVTLAGETFTSRVATSLLHAVGLGSLSVGSRAEYVRLAVELACNPVALARLKVHLEAVRFRAPLFDTPRYCRHLEDAYTEICARHRRGEDPADVWVTARARRS